MEVQQWLKEAAQAFDMQLGIVSKIENNRYVVEAAYSSLDLVKPGDEFSLDMTYCADVVSQAKVLDYQQVGAMTDMCLHPCYQAMHLESYIGTPLVKHGEIIGTLNFSSLEPKKQGFSDKDREKIQMLANEYLALLDLAVD
ncbi:GAF domain-containing protein [Agarivorans litoreus]|uniref:GAF domain-containing protein n=1 Tax=Agarivorans litoreus TaxID=1510455 RepID=UPI001C7D4ED7|nr:GAF domain-containing protein [Agarivorans litoreus]